MNQIKAMQLIASKKQTSHVVHLLVCLLTIGMWLPIWVLIGVSNSLHNSSVDRKLNKLAKESQ